MLLHNSRITIVCLLHNRDDYDDITNRRAHEIEVSKAPQILKIDHGSDIDEGASCDDDDDSAISEDEGEGEGEGEEEVEVEEKGECEPEPLVTHLPS